MARPFQQLYVQWILLDNKSFLKNKRPRESLPSRIRIQALLAPEASKPAVAMRFNTGSGPHGNVEGAIIQFEIVPRGNKREALEMCGRHTHICSALASVCKRG